MVANVGDSRAVLATLSDDGDLVPFQLTVDFKPNLPGQLSIFSLSFHINFYVYVYDIPISYGICPLVSVGYRGSRAYNTVQRASVLPTR